LCGDIGDDGNIDSCQSDRDTAVFGHAVSAVAELILPVIIPFNLLKAGINSIVTLLIFFRSANPNLSNFNEIIR
jgi:riboflavin transporter FmnP